MFFTLVISLFFMVDSFCQNIDKLYLRKSEQKIIAPQYCYGNNSILDSVYTFVKNLDIPNSSSYKQSIYFTILINNAGKIIDHKNFSSKDSSLEKFRIALPIWLKNIDCWKAAYDKKSNKKINNYSISFMVFLGNNIKIVIRDRNSKYLCLKEFPNI